MTTFTTFGLPDFILRALSHLNIETPTPIQAQAIPMALEGADIVATAQTGTGKTMAYLLPIITKMKDCAHERALILAPTRELAEQIKNALVALLGRKGQHDVALLIGGAAIFKQFAALKKQPRFIIGTPGRIIDHLERGKLDLSTVRFLILDEMDRMLDMGFTEALEVIMQEVPKERQTLMFSATLPPNIAKMSKKYLSHPKQITIGSITKPSQQVKQESIKASAGERFTILLDELKTREGSVIIFVKTKIGADSLAEKLQNKGFEADAIHGDLRQRQREAVIRSFRKGAISILVATDIAARGLDIPHIKHVINYDLPQCAEDYIHRIGRTGRAGMEGFALSFVLPSEGGKWKAIHRLLNASDSEKAYANAPKEERPFRSQNRKGRSFGPKRGGEFSSEGRSFGSKRRASTSEEGRSFKPKRSSGGASSEEGRSFSRPKRNGESFSEGRSFRPKRSGESSSEGRSFGSKRSSASTSEEGRSFKPKRSSASASEGRSFKPKRSASGSEGRSFKPKCSAPSQEGRRFAKKHQDA